MRLSAPCLLATLTLAGSAAAQDRSFQVPAGQSTQVVGYRFAETVTIDGRVEGKRYAANAPGSGWLHLAADKIVVGSTGIIDLAGRGFSDPSAPGTPGAPPIVVPADSYDPMPGGGGSHRGMGAVGRAGNDSTNINCSMPFPGNRCDVVAEAAGGMPFDDILGPLALGADPSAGMGGPGGRSYGGCPNENPPFFGISEGGGVIILEAYELEIDGTLDASGLAQDASLLGGQSPGGGAGGTIILRAIQTLSLGPNARLLAEGAAGTEGTTVGGGGGGGLILVQAPGIVGALDNDCAVMTPCASVAGGASADCATAEAGEKAQAQAPACLDADRDGASSDRCGGDDCDDADPNTFRDAPEICDGRDNDCDGEVDEDPATLCTAGAGEICVAGECVTPSGTGGMGAGSGGAGEAPRLVLSGGLCSHSAGPSEDPLGVWLLGAALAGLWRRRRPATRGPRDRGPHDRG